MQHTASERTGWSGMQPPNTVERKRKRRAVDIIPTPPRVSVASHLPTPESVRRSAKPQKKTAIQHATLSATSQLPTPQTLPRKRTSPHAGPRASTTTDDHAPPSPSGHTTFFLSSSSAARGLPAQTDAYAPIRRRPGLTFAQQMGLLANPSASASGSSRPGLGVGMGGMRSSAHGKVDQISRAAGTGRSAALALAESANVVEDKEENPFLASPGPITSHRPIESLDVDTDDEQLASPLQYRGPTNTALVTPATKRSTKPLTSAADAEKRRRAKQEMRRMMDAEDNPFLDRSSPSSSLPRKRVPLVDESRPTVTYVFRGAKKVFANPFLPPNTTVPQAELNPEDDDFEPHPCPPPKLLWPTGPALGQPRLSFDDAETDNEDVSLSPPSSPMGMVETPAPKRIKFSGRFVSEENVKAPSRVFESDDEFELEQPGMDRRMDVDEDEDVPVRKGLLFGPGAMSGTGTNRAGQSGQAGTSANKVTNAGLRA